MSLLSCYVHLFPTHSSINPSIHLLSSFLSVNFYFPSPFSLRLVATSLLLCNLTCFVSCFAICGVDAVVDKHNSVVTISLRLLPTLCFRLGRCTWNVFRRLLKPGFSRECSFEKLQRRTLKETSV